MNKRRYDQAMNEPPSASGKIPPTTLILAFTPAALLLATFAAASMRPVGRFFNSIPGVQGFFLVLACGVSVVCCFVASIRLFRRGTGAAILGGILLLLLNGFIAFCFGCGAMLTQMHI